MSWNYRIMAHEHKGEITLIIHEVHYKDKKPDSYSENAAPVMGDTKVELAGTISMMTECFKKPILWYGEKFPEEYSPKDITKSESNPEKS